MIAFKVFVGLNNPIFLLEGEMQLVKTSYIDFPELILLEKKIALYSNY